MSTRQINLPVNHIAAVEITIPSGQSQSRDVTWAASGDVQINVPEMPGARTASVMRTGPGNGSVTATVYLAQDDGGEIQETHVFSVTTDGSQLSSADVTHIPPQ